MTLAFILTIAVLFVAWIWAASGCHIYKALFAGAIEDHASIRLKHRQELTRLAKAVKAERAAIQSNTDSPDATWELDDLIEEYGSTETAEAEE